MHCIKTMNYIKDQTVVVLVLFLACVADSFLIGNRNSLSASCNAQILHIVLQSQVPIYNLTMIQWAVHPQYDWKHVMVTCTNEVCKLSADRHRMDIRLRLHAYTDIWAYAINHITHYTMPGDWYEHPNLVHCLTSPGEHLNPRNPFNLWMLAFCDIYQNLKIEVHLGTISLSEYHGIQYAVEADYNWGGPLHPPPMHYCKDNCITRGGDTIIITTRAQARNIKLAINVIGFRTLPPCNNWKKYPFRLTCDGSYVDSRVRGPPDDWFTCGHVTHKTTTSTTQSTTILTTTPTTTSTTPSTKISTTKPTTTSTSPSKTVSTTKPTTTSTTPSTTILTTTPTTTSTTPSTTISPTKPTTTSTTPSTTILTTTPATTSTTPSATISTTKPTTTSATPSTKISTTNPTTTTSTTPSTTISTTESTTTFTTPSTIILTTKLTTTSVIPSTTTSTMLTTTSTTPSITISTTMPKTTSTTPSTTISTTMPTTTSTTPSTIMSTTTPTTTSTTPSTTISPTITKQTTTTVKSTTCKVFPLNCPAGCALFDMNWCPYCDLSVCGATVNQQKTTTPKCPPMFCILNCGNPPKYKMNQFGCPRCECASVVT